MDRVVIWSFGYGVGMFGAFCQIDIAEMAVILLRIIQQELIPVVAVDFTYLLMKRSFWSGPERRYDRCR